MAAEEPPAKPRRNRLGALKRLWTRDKAPARAEPDAEDDGSPDIVDQAEAFKSMRVADVMTPRADIVAVELATTFSELLAEFIEAEHSRMPIYRETLDDPIGVVHVKDVFKLVANEAKRPAPDETVLKKLKRAFLAVPPSMPAAALLAKMQASRTHMAMVIDEFGGVDGLVTLEDLIEAVVGEIDDEYDEIAPAQIIARAGAVFDADGRAPLDELESTLETQLTPPDVEEDIDTLAGLVGILAGRVPQRGEVISHPSGFEFEITDADPRRVKRVRIRKVEPPEANADGEGAEGAPSAK
jgi:CBS domain containing-hemolysin-like protein